MISSRELRDLVARGNRPAGSFAALAIAALLSAAVAPSAGAQETLSPYVDSHIEHDSNVYRVPNSETLYLENGDATLGDTDVKYIAGLNGTYLWSDQTLTGKIEVRHVNYFHYSDLDHNENSEDIAYKWRFSSLIDGVVEGRRDSAMAPFVLGNSTQLTIDVDDIVIGKANFNLNPDWRLEAGETFHHLDAPLQDYPEYMEREETTHVGIVNHGVTNLSYGLSADRLEGRFDNAPNVGPYAQTTEDFNWNYTVSALTTLSGSLGYSKRTQNAEDVGAYTGTLVYFRQLTGLTSLNVALTRAVNSYAAAGGSEIDTTATVGLNYQATYKIGIALNGGYTRSKFVGQVIPGTGAPGSETNGRVDRLPLESLNVTYQVLKKLSLRAYLIKQSRTSDIEFYNFSDTLMGIDARYSWR